MTATELSRRIWVRHLHTPIARVRPRTSVVVGGTVQAIETVVYGSSPACRCALSDGSGELDLLFLGRREVAGLEVGRRCEAQGTARLDDGRLVIWNPLYRLPFPREPIARRPNDQTYDGGEGRPHACLVGANAPER